MLPRKVVQICEAGIRGIYVSGVTNVAAGIQEFLISLGIECVTVGADNLPYKKIQRVYPSTAPFLIFSWPTILSFARNADLVHVHSITPLSIFTIWMLSIMKNRPKIVLTLHTDANAYLKIWGKKGLLTSCTIAITNCLTKYCCLHADRVLVPSEHFRLQLMKEIKLPENFWIMPWPAPIAMPNLPNVSREDLLNGGSVRLHPDSKILCYFGRVGSEKGIDDLLEIFCALDRDLNISLVLIGGGEIEKYQAMVPDELKDRVSFFGHRPREYAMALARHAYLAITCSKTETQGLTSFELMLVRLMLLAYSQTCFAEAIIRSAGGILLSSSKDSWIETIEFLAISPRAVSEMGKDAEKYVLQYYSPKVRYSALMKVYEDIISP
jgi:glycosyltransferase involved in cell wall biosynthesis